MPTGVNTQSQTLWLECERLVQKQDENSITTAGAATLTAAQVLGGIILRDPNGASRTDTLPTAALLIGAMLDPSIGDTFRCTIINTADAAETITIQEGTGGTASGQPAASKVIAQNASGELIIRVTGIGSSAAYTWYLSV